jgi:hypothetical protein
LQKNTELPGDISTVLNTYILNSAYAAPRIMKVHNSHASTDGYAIVSLTQLAGSPTSGESEKMREEDFLPKEEDKMTGIIWQ